EEQEARPAECRREQSMHGGAIAQIPELGARLKARLELHPIGDWVVADAQVASTVCLLEWRIRVEPRHALRVLENESPQARHTLERHEAAYEQIAVALDGRT